MKATTIKARRETKSGKAVNRFLLPEAKDRMVLYSDMTQRIPVSIADVLEVWDGGERLKLQHDTLVKASKRYQTLTLNELMTYFPVYL